MLLPARYRGVRLALGCLLLWLAACAQVKPRIRSEPFDFGGTRATVRAFPPGAICEAEPRFLIDELSSVNGLLSRFLEGVPSGEDRAWSEAAIILADEAAARLPPLLDLHRRSLVSLSSCAFAAQGAWPALISRGHGLLQQTRLRLETAPDEVRKVREAQALELWRKERFAQQRSARGSCPRRQGAAVIYFAWREGAHTHWLFCDGAEVTREGQQRPYLESAPAELARGRRPAEGAYFSAAARHPGAEVLAAPGDEALTAW